jgi:hypothetical protein
LERGKNIICLLYSAHGQIPLRTVPDLKFLTVAHNQARFDIGANIFIDVLLIDSKITTFHDVQQHAVMFIISP